MPEIITNIPSPQELVGSYGSRRGPFNDEFLPRGYIDRDASEARKAHRRMLETLRSELHFGNPDQFTDTIRAGYGIARSIGDIRIAELSPEAFSLISSSRNNGESWGMKVSATTPSEDSLGEVGTISGGHLGIDTPKFMIDMQEVFNGSHSSAVVTENLRRVDATIAPADISLFIFLKTVAHESGHIIQGGVGKLLYKDTPDGLTAYDVMSTELISQRPEIAQTPHAYTSARIHNERFAEGYATLVLREAAQILGYDDETITKLDRALSAGNVTSLLRQHLAEVTADKSLTDVLSEKGVSGYEGELGYALPLSPQALVADLEYMNAHLHGHDMSEVSQSFEQAYLTTPTLVPEHSDVLLSGHEAKVAPPQPKKFGQDVLRRLMRRGLPGVLKKAA